MNKHQDDPVLLVWTKDLIERFWSGFSRTKLTEISFCRQAAGSLLLCCRRNLPEHGKFLDYGAGDGDLLRELVKQGFSSCAYEPSEDRRRRIQRTLQGESKFLGVIDGGHAENFDVVFACEVIEHVVPEELDDFIARVTGFVKPGGMLIITTPNGENLDLGMCYCPVCNHLYHRWQHLGSFNQNSLSTIFENSGFETIAVHQIEFSDKYFQPYLDYLGGTTEPPLECRETLEFSDENEPVNVKLKHGWVMLKRKSMFIKNILKNEKINIIPDYVYDILENKNAQVGLKPQLLYIGRKII